MILVSIAFALITTVAAINNIGHVYSGRSFGSTCSFATTESSICNKLIARYQTVYVGNCTSVTADCSTFIKLILLETESLDLSRCKESDMFALRKELLHYFLNTTQINSDCVAHMDALHQFCFVEPDTTNSPLLKLNTLLLHGAIGLLGNTII